MPITVLQKPLAVYNYFRTTGFIFLLLVGFQLGDTALGQKPAEQQTPAANSQPEPQVAAVSPAPSQTAVEQPQRGIEAKEGKKEPTAFWNATLADWIQVGINATLLLIIAFQTAIYWQQRSMMQRQIENAKIAERAYIGVQQIVNENLTVGAVPVVRLTLINGGRTPAYNFKTPCHITITRDGLAFPHERPKGSTKESDTFLASGSWTTLSIPFTITLTPAWLHAIQEGQYHVYLHLEAHFVDVWGLAQTATFKFEYRPQDDRWGGYGDPEERKPIIKVT